MSAEVVRRSAVARLPQEQLAAVVRLRAAVAQRALHVAAIRVFLPCEQAAARVVGVAAAMRAVIEVAVVVGAARLKERSPGEGAVTVHVFLRDAGVEGDAVQIHVGARSP